MRQVQHQSGARAQVSRNDFCWSCGSVVGPPIGPPCPRCQTLRDGPKVRAHPLTAQHVEFRSGLKRDRGFVLSANDSAALVKTEGGLRTVPSDKLEVRGGLLEGDPALRLFKAGQFDAVRQALVDIASRRAFAAAAIEDRNVPALEVSGLSRSERNWAAMWCCHRHVEGWAAVDRALELGAGPIYPDRLGVLLAWVECWGDDESKREQVLNLVREFPREPAGRLLLPLLHGRLDGGELQETLAVARSRGVPGALTPAAALPKALLGFAGAPVDFRSMLRGMADLTPSVRLLLTEPGGHPGPLAGIDMRQIDDAIEQGVVRAEHLGDGTVVDGLTEAELAYLGVRLDPGSLSDERLALLGDTEEGWRRRAARDDVQLPDDDRPGIVRLRLLRRLHRGESGVIGELAPLLLPGPAEVATAVDRMLAGGPLDAAAVEDPSTWEVVAQRLASADITELTTPALRDAAGWALLARAQEHLFSWRFAEAITDAADCLRLVDDEARRDEALSIKAAAAWMRGDEGFALQYLIEAAEGDASDSLLVNLAFIAREVDPEVAAGALSRLASQASDPILGARAGVECCILSRQIDEDWSPDAALLDVVRRGASLDIGLDHYRQMLAILSAEDPEWLADPDHTEGAPSEMESERRLASARAQGLEAVIDLLSEALTENPDDGMLVDERGRLAEGAIALMLEEEEPQLGAAQLAMQLAERVPMSGSQSVFLTVLALREFAYAARQSSPVERFPEVWRELLLETEEDLDDSDLVDPDSVRGLIADTFDLIDQTDSMAWQRELDAMIDVYNGRLEQLRSVGEQVVPARRIRLDEEFEAACRELLELLECLIAEVVARNSSMDGSTPVAEFCDLLLGSAHGFRERLWEETS